MTMDKMILGALAILPIMAAITVLALLNWNAGRNGGFTLKELIVYTGLKILGVVLMAFAAVVLWSIQ